MQHTRHEATTVALRAVLAALVVVVGLACLFSHATAQSGQSQAASDEVSVSRVVAHASTDVSNEERPCAKKLMTSEAAGSQADSSYQASGVPALLSPAQRADVAQRFGSMPLPSGPAPPPPLPPFSVMRV